jgi:hypothetical protein
LDAETGATTEVYTKPVREELQAMIEEMHHKFIWHLTYVTDEDTLQENVYSDQQMFPGETREQMLNRVGVENMEKIWEQSL